MSPYSTKSSTSLEEWLSYKKEDSSYEEDSHRKTIWLYLLYNNSWVGQSWLRPLIGCPSIVVSGGLVINPKHRGSEGSNLFRNYRIDFAKQLGFSYMLATNNAQDPFATAAIEKVGYKKLDDFYNTDTNHLVSVRGLNLHSGDLSHIEDYD